jgi:hypothetical protein
MGHSAPLLRYAHSSGRLHGRIMHRDWFPFACFSNGDISAQRLWISTFLGAEYFLIIFASIQADQTRASTSACNATFFRGQAEMYRSRLWGGHGSFVSCLSEYTGRAKVRGQKGIWLAAISITTSANKFYLMIVLFVVFIFVVFVWICDHLQRWFLLIQISALWPDILTSPHTPKSEEMEFYTSEAMSTQELGSPGYRRINARQSVYNNIAIL